MTLPLQHFYMIRHGETEANAAQVMAGSIDSPLTERGISQAHAAAKVVEQLEIKPQIIYHSHLSRARDTATIINSKLNVEMIEDPDLAEMHAGEMEGVPYEISRTLFTTWEKVPGGESPEEFFARVKRGKTRALSDSNRPALIVCHGGVMRAFGEINNIPTPGIFKNAHLYEFTPKNQSELSAQNLAWHVHDYEFCETTHSLIRSTNNAYQKENKAA